MLKPRLIENSSAASLDVVLTKVPGLNILDGQAQIRGGAGFSQGAGTRVLLLLDDLPALQPDAGYPNWNDFPIENVSQVEVLKGAASALYGSSAMNGIVNLRTQFAKNQPETKVAVWAKIWGTPDDERQAWWKSDTSKLSVPHEVAFNFLHKQKAGKWDIVLGGMGLTRREFNYATYADYGRVTPNFRYQVNDRLSIGLNTNWNYGRSGSFFVWHDDTTGVYLPGLNSVSETKSRFRFTVDPSVLYTDKFGNRHKFLGRYYSIHNNNNSNQSNSSQNLYGEYQFQRNFEEIGLVLTAGAVGQQSLVHADLYGGDFKANNWATYLQLDYQPIERLNLSTGLRYEKFIQYSPSIISEFGGTVIDTIPDGKTAESKPVFRFGANYRLGVATYLRGSWGQGFRYPTIAEKFISTSFSSGNEISPNAKLASESGWTAELGLKQGFKIGDWQGFVDLAIFQSEYSRMMEFVLAQVDIFSNPKQVFFQSQNIGDVRVRGWEVSVAGQSKLGTGTLSVLAGFTHVDPVYKNFTPEDRAKSSNDTVNVLKYRFRDSFKWDSEYETDKFSAGVALQFNSFMEAVDRVFAPKKTDILYDPKFGIPEFAAVTKFRDRNHNGYYLLDLRVGYKLNKQLKASFLVGNLLNQQYYVRPALLEGPRNFTLRFDYKI